MSVMRNNSKTSNLIHKANQTIVALNAESPESVTDFYRVPINPTPTHVKRMIDDLDFWLDEHEDELRSNDEAFHSYFIARRRLTDLRNAVLSEVKAKS